MDKWSENDASDFIVRTCQLLPASCVGGSDPISIHSAIKNRVPISYSVDCGSSQELYILPPNSCIDDHDELMYRVDMLAFKEDFPVLPNDFRRLADTIDCYKIEPYFKYPGFVRLRAIGKMNYDWKRKKYQFTHACAPNIYYAANTTANIAGIRPVKVRPTGQSKALRGPAITVTDAIDSAGKDVVYCVRCPEWPKEAENWPERRRHFGWPKTGTISEVLESGCHVVYAQHRLCRDDVVQLRLSFSVAEVILLQSWTPVQQIVYHLLRFFAKRELIQKDCPKDDEVICTYHIKTLVLWACEYRPPEWWSSTSVITICSDLLESLSVFLKERYCPNYFIPESNLFHGQWNPKVCEQVEELLNIFCNSEILCDWFVENYILPFSRIIINFAGTMNTREENLNFMDLIPSLFDIRKENKLIALDILFSDGLEYCKLYADHTLRSKVRNEPISLLYLMISTRRCLLLKNHVGLMPLLPMPECVSSFSYFDTTLFSLHAAETLECEQRSWNIELFAEYFKGIFMTPKIVRCQYHIFPKPIFAEESKFKFLRAQDFMEDLTGSNSRSEDQLMFLFSKELLQKVLECEDSESSNVNPATLVYVAALHFAASEKQIASDLCSVVLMDKTTNTDSETLNGGCLFFIDDVVRIVGFYLLCKRLDEQMELRKKQVYLDLRLTPKVLAYYLTGGIPPELDLNLSNSKYPLNQFFLLLARRKSFTSMASDMSGIALRQCVYRREASFNKNLCANPLIAKERVIGLLVDYALENMTMFYSGIRKDFGIECNTVDCYRALYLYKCRRYGEVLQLCELILHTPDLQSDFTEFANVTLLPPLDSFFDRDVQSLLGFHTIFICLMFWLNPESNLGTFDFSEFTASTANCSNEGPEYLLGSQPNKYYYILRRHFVARYLKLRCLVDSNQRYAEATSEVAAMKIRLPFELIIRFFILRKLY